jgi:hypothetical protein
MTRGAPWLVCLLAASAGAHPADETLVRYETQVVCLTSGLRVDLYVLPGGLAVTQWWSRYDPEGRGALDDSRQSAWARDLAARIRLRIDNQRRELTVQSWEFPSFEAMITCRQPILVRTEPAGDSPLGRPVAIEVGLEPEPGFGALARQVFLAPASVAVRDERHQAGAATATVTWPPAGAPLDTRLPGGGPAAWLTLPTGALDLGLLTPAPRRPWWPAAAILAAGSGLAWRRRRRARRGSG